uniref:Ubiquitin-like domain-containing protein n=1 Tax=Aureoumbra lagunensis TaxID=44058 RepID=A0A7S3NIG3_9STRA
MVQLFVNLPTGEDTKTVDVDPALTVAGLRELIADEEFIPEELQRLVVGTKTLTMGTLEDNGLEEGDSVQLLLDVVGGGEASRYKKSTSCMRWKVCFLKN